MSAKIGEELFSIEFGHAADELAEVLLDQLHLAPDVDFLEIGRIGLH